MPADPEAGFPVATSIRRVRTGMGVPQTISGRVSEAPWSRFATA